ncbi:MAG: histidinol-phosphate transaminase [Anaerolineales bacterium]
MTKRNIPPRSEVAATPLDQHGALNFEELTRLGIAPDEIIDFSVNSNPWGPSPVVRKALQKVIIDRYPDRESLALRTALSKKFGLELSQIMIGNGTSELLWLVAMAFVHPGDTALTLNPTFGEYARSASLMGAKIESIIAKEQNNFALASEAVYDALQGTLPRIAFVCNPNNPTGITFAPEIIRNLAKSHPNTLFVIDEAYIQFVPDLQSCMSLSLPNILVLRSMTKDYGIAGLRLGYAVGQAGMIESLVKVRSPWNVNAVAQDAGLAALMDDAYLSQTLTRLNAAKGEFLSELQGLGLQPIPSKTHYFIIKVGNAAEFRLRLLVHKIQVRDCASFGLSEYIRVSTKTPAENRMFLYALKEIL